MAGDEGRADGWPAWLLAGFAAVLVAGGLWATGGPAAGRAERRDGVRLGDLGLIRDAVGCLDTVSGGDAGGGDDGAVEAPPGALAELDDLPATGCGLPPRRTDPYAGTPYGFERVDARRYRLCAAFERPDLLEPYAYSGEAFDPATGCMDVTLPPPVAEAA